MIGVSPAYHISRCSDRFSFQDQIDSLPLLKQIGFGAMQIEIFHRDRMEEWSGENGRLLKKASLFSGIELSQFVAHFLMEVFTTPEGLASEAGLSELEHLSGLLYENDLTDLITVPLGAFKAVPTPKVKNDFIGKLSSMKMILEKKGQRLAIEPVPGSLGADLAVLDEIPGLGLNLDPGHLLCSGINPFELGSETLGRVFATHLCDNDGMTNSSCLPGTFHPASDWRKLLENLAGAGYAGSLDLEIICPAEEVEELYLRGRNFISIFEYNIVHSKIQQVSGTAAGYRRS